MHSVDEAVGQCAVMEGVPPEDLLPRGIGRHPVRPHCKERVQGGGQGRVEGLQQGPPRYPLPVDGELAQDVQAFGEQTG